MLMKGNDTKMQKTKIQEINVHGLSVEKLSLEFYMQSKEPTLIMTLKLELFMVIIKEMQLKQRLEKVMKSLILLM